MNPGKLLLSIALLTLAGNIVSMGAPSKQYLQFLKAYSQHKVIADEIIPIYQKATANLNDREAIDKLILGTHFSDTYNDYLEALLKTKKIDPNAYRFENDSTPLMQVTFSQYPNKVSLLLLYGAAIEAQDCNGQTALDYLNSPNSIDRGAEVKNQIQNMLEEAQEKARPKLLKKELKTLEINRICTYLTSHPSLLTGESLQVNLRK